jgi:glutamate-1-semialdehyde 2,1-aminomutase
MVEREAAEALVEDYVEYAEGLDTRRSSSLYNRAAKVMPGGASSHGQCYPVFTPYPLGFEKGEGSRVWDLDGNRYLDFVLAMGPLIHGHAHPKLIKAVRDQLEKGTMFAALHDKEVDLAEKVCEMTGMDMVRFSNSGAEATQTAVRLARGHTGKDKIIKFEGAYHGGHDYVLFGNGALPMTGPPTAMFRTPGSWGIPEETAKNTLLVRWNDADSLEKVVKRNADDLAAIISEPVLMNIGTVPPEEGFLQLMRSLCDESGSLFILDEVITGFRLARGGAQEYFGVRADITTYAKALGAGFPISAIAGRRRVMEDLVPGKVFHAGTYNANPLAVVAALASLAELERPGTYQKLKMVGDRLQSGLEEAVEKTNTEALVQGVGPGGCQLYFTKLKKVRNFQDYLTTDGPKYMKMHKKLLKKGVYFHPQQYEHLFVSTQHSLDDADEAVAGVEQVLKDL